VREGRERTIDNVWGRLGPGQLLRNAQNAEDGHRYTIVFDFPPDHGFFGFHRIPGLGLLIGIVSSGFVCFLLARYLTSPLVRLRAATQRLSAGDLSARAGEPGAHRHDEIAELVRDFDAMAVRIQNLVNAQNRLLNDISHELRSPLARLNVALGLVRRKTLPEVQGSLDRIEQEADRLNELIGRLLTVARLESGEDQLLRSQISLTELLREIAQDAEFESQSRSCRVRVTGTDDCIVMGSPELLRSALENVIRNATRYTAEGTNVDVKVQCRGAEAVVEVSDSGPGVPEAALDKLFRPFYRIDDSRERGTGGVGLGLSITERAVRLHSGNVRAVNRPQGGLMVEIRLPARAASVSEEVTPEMASKT
jgi:two-component system sensor histidine kinase CpxA